MSDFWRFVDLPLINCETEPALRQGRNFTVFEISRTAAVGGHNPVETTTTTSATFQINNAKIYVSVVTLSMNDNIKFLKIIKQWFRRTMS